MQREMNDSELQVQLTRCQRQLCDALETRDTLDEILRAMPQSADFGVCLRCDTR